MGTPKLCKHDTYGTGRGKYLTSIFKKVLRKLSGPKNQIPSNPSKYEYPLHVFPREEDWVDVKKLIRDLTDKELIEAANNYWTGIGADSEQVYKPFSNSATAPQQLKCLSELLSFADLSENLTVLDYGCATGWFAMALAEMGMVSHGVDIAEKSIVLARQRLKKHGLRKGASVKFKLYDGRTLPYPDAFFDRILVFDAFHHVRDVPGSLEEMSRVLKPGGRVAMSEPYFGHSSAPWSQHEMKNFTVIENDIDIPTIAECAECLGFEPPVFNLISDRPSTVVFEKNENWLDDAAIHNHFMQTLNGMVHTPFGLMFYLQKSADILDSRLLDYTVDESSGRANSRCDGLALPEVRGAWTEKKKVKIDIPLRRHELEGVSLEFLLSPLITNDCETFDLKFFLGDDLLQVIEFAPDKHSYTEFYEFVIEVPKEKLKNSKVLPIRLVCDTLKTPAELGLNDDVRKIGVCLRSINVKRWPPS